MGSLCQSKDECGGDSLKMYGFGRDQNACAYAAAYHMRVPVRTRVEMIGSDHGVAASMLMLLMCKTAAVSARTRRQRAAFSIRD